MVVFDSGVFWFVEGVLACLAVLGFRLWTQDRGIAMPWWKWLLVALWYAVFSLSFFASGTLVGENEPKAGLRVLVLGLFLSLILGVGLVRVLAYRGKAPAPAPPVEEA